MAAALPYLYGAIATTAVSRATAPKLPKTIVAPTPDEKAARRGKERMAQRRYGASGRAGTMLTGDESTLG